MADRLRLLRREKKLRREEEERRQQRAAPTLLEPSTSTNSRRKEARPDPVAARPLPSRGSKNDEARPAYVYAAATKTTQQRLESQKKIVAKDKAPISTPSSPSPEQPTTRKRSRASETPVAVARVREPPALTTNDLLSRPTFGRATSAPPKEVLPKHLYASPASSVSFSQSPGKDVAVPPKLVALALVPQPLRPPPSKRDPTTMFRDFVARDSSSSEEEDEDLQNHFNTTPQSPQQGRSISGHLHLHPYSCGKTTHGARRQAAVQEDQF
jgi:hypothetical protein